MLIQCRTLFYYTVRWDRSATLHSVWLPCWKEKMSFVPSSQKCQWRNFDSVSFVLIVCAIFVTALFVCPPPTPPLLFVCPLSWLCCVGHPTTRISFQANTLRCSSFRAVCKRHTLATSANGEKPVQQTYYSKFDRIFFVAINPAPLIR